LSAPVAFSVPAADARIAIRVGMGEQNISMFDNPAFQAMELKRIRFLFPWDGMNKDSTRLAARAYVKRARADGYDVLLHITTNDYTIKKAHLVSVSGYRRYIRRIVAYFRDLGVREFGTWDEANHASQPTWDAWGHAADYFREMYWAVKGRCHTCAVVALDVLDQAGVERYISRFFRHLSSTFRRRATVVGIHNYGDVNRNRTRFTSSMIRETHKYNRRSRIWITESGAIVNFGRSFPCDLNRAADRIGNAFSLAHRYRSAHVDRMYLYNWLGPGCQARFDAGLVNPDGSPRPAYDAVRKDLVHYIR